MSGLTLRKIINNEEYFTKYGDFISDIERQMEKTPNTYYLNKVYSMSLDDEITVDVLNNAMYQYNLYMSQDIKTHIPFTENEKMNPYLDILNEIVLKNENENEKTVCCGGLFTPNNKNKIASYEKEFKKGVGSEYIFYKEMDEANKKMMDVYAEKGMDGMVKAICDEMKEQKMTYAEMRARYG